jgi:hypothetical protein
LEEGSVWGGVRGRVTGLQKGMHATQKVDWWVGMRGRFKGRQIGVVIQSVQRDPVTCTAANIHLCRSKNPSLKFPLKLKRMV